MCRRLLKPLARLLLRTGMTYTEFSELARTTFVDVAIGEFGRNGRPANLSRVAIITGLSRREVRRIRDQIAKNPSLDGGDGIRFWSPAMRVLSGWHQDPEFTDESGKPLVLPMGGEDPSLHGLLTRYCADIPHGAMLSELERVGAIRMEKGRARALTRNYVNTDQSPEVLAMVGSFVHDFASTLEFNLQAGAAEHAWFQRVAQNTHIKPSALRSFRKIVARDGQAMLENLDAWLSAHEADDEDDDQLQAGVGVYFFQDRHRTRTYKMTWSESLRARARDGDGDGQTGEAALPTAVSAGEIP